MSKIFRETEPCPMCGHESERFIVMSTHAFGSADLDLRPPEQTHHTLFYRLQECPECGYVYLSGELKPIVEKSFIEREEYKTCEGFNFASENARCFYHHYMMMIKLKRKKDALQDLIVVAWACDDANDENAAKIREKIVTLMDQINKGFFQKTDEEQMVQRADFLRRSRQWERLLKEYTGKRYEKDILNKVMTFELKLAKEHDDKCYTIQQAID